MADENTNLPTQTSPPRPNDSTSKPSSAVIGLEEILKDLPPKIVNPQAPLTSPLSPRIGSTTPSLPSSNQVQTFIQRPPVTMQTPSQSSPSSFPPRTGGLATSPLSNTPLSSNQTVIKGEVRTMRDDLSALEKGKTPIGSPVELKPEKSQLPPPSQPKVEVPKFSPPSFQASMGGTEKTKGLVVPEPIKPQQPQLQPKILAPSLPKTTPPIGIPTPKPGLSKKLIFIVIGVLIIGGGAYLYLMREPEIAFTPTPTETILTETPAPLPLLGQLFPDVETVDDNFFKERAITKEGSLLQLTASNLDFNQFISVRLTAKATREDQPEQITNLTFEEFLSFFNIIHPSDLLNNIDTNDWSVLVYGQKEYFDKGVQKDSSTPLSKIGLIVQVKDEVALRSALNIWESTLVSDINEFLTNNKNNAATGQFLETFYGDSVVRYINFPYPDKTIDYAIIKAKNRGKYFVITNSRESMFSLIDQIGDFNSLGI